jgi:hypothetical protein
MRGATVRDLGNGASLEASLRDLDARNRDNVTRTESYLELYAYTRDNPPDLPWLLMAHLVSRNGGYLMSDVADSIARGGGAFSPGALVSLFAMLERANFLIFYDAWHHVLLHLLGRSGEASSARVTPFVRAAWSRYESAHGEAVATASAEKQLVRDLVTNEQNFIERRVVHAPRFAQALAIVEFGASIGRETPIVLPDKSRTIHVGRFALLGRRIEVGWRIFDEILADRAERERLFAWAMAHPHTGSRAVYGGRATRTIREAWPADQVRKRWEGIHAPPEADPLW